MWLIGGTQDLAGAIDGVNRVFVASVAVRPDAQVYVNGLARLPGAVTDNGYALTDQTVVLGEAPVPGDTVALWQATGSSSGPSTPINGPTPVGGGAQSTSPTLTLSGSGPEGMTWPPPSGSTSTITPQGGTTWPTSA